jgi:hypothetical protein
MTVINTANLRYIVDGEPVNQVVLNRPTQDLVTQIEASLGTVRTDVINSTSANTASQIVRRDASGNFSASIISAIDFNTTSDARAKTNIIAINDLHAHDVIESLHPVAFEWQLNGVSAFGFIAQEIETILPEIIVEREDGYKGVSYSQIIPFLVKEIQTLNNRVQILEAELTNQGV